MSSSEIDQRTLPPTTTATVIAGLFLGTVSFMITGIQPVLLGGLVEEKRLTDAMLGRLAWVEVFVLALAAAIGPSLIRLGSARRTVSAGCLVLALANAEVFVSHKENLLVASRVVAGLMEGLLLATANIAITRARHPQRLNATLLMVSALPQAAVAYALAAIVIPRFGADSGFGLLCALAVAAVFVALLLGPEIQDKPSRRPGTQVWTPAVFIGLCGVSLQNAANSAGWMYLARFGEILHFSGHVIGSAMAANLVFQVIGTFAVAWVAWRLPFKMMLLATAILQAALIATMTLVDAPSQYIAVSALFGMIWLGALPYQMSLLIDLDKTRQVALMLASFQIVGFSVGPLICSFFVGPGNVRGAFWCAAVMVLLAFMTYLAAIVVSNIAPVARVPARVSAGD